MYRQADFVALDFETADYGRDSACALALVRVEGSRIVQRGHYLIRPPRRRFIFSYLHGITWDMVAEAPTFGELWPQIVAMTDGVAFLSAQNAAFDRGVLHACCEAAGLAAPPLPFVCTVELARRQWQLYPTKLPNVCSFLNIPLEHHNPASDAEACARIILAARCI
jgi:DNA polymerase-3 subunit epsilon